MIIFLHAFSVVVHCHKIPSLKHTVKYNIFTDCASKQYEIQKKK